MRIGTETYHALKRMLQDLGLSTAVGDEGGFAPNLPSNEEAVRLLVAAIESAGFAPGDDIAIALDPASTEFYENGKYVLAGEGRELTHRQVQSACEHPDAFAELSRQAAHRRTAWSGRQSSTAGGRPARFVGCERRWRPPPRAEVGHAKLRHDESGWIEAQWVAI
jgi:hypothetical protein